MKSIVVEYELAHPPAKVWRALTEPALIASWLMPTDLVPEVGRKFTFRSKPMGSWDGVVHCQILEADVGRRLRYSWVGGTDGEMVSKLDSIVDWTLTPTATGTLLRLEHSGFQPQNAMAFEAMGKGWRDHVQNSISRVLDTL